VEAPNHEIYGLFPFKVQLVIVEMDWLNWSPDGALRWKVKTIG
jgi:hypothetical protein